MNQADHLLREGYIYEKELPELYESYDTGVGFDLVKCKVYIKSVDWDTLNGWVKKSNGLTDYASKKIEDHIRYTLAEGKNKPLDIEGNAENGSYSSIMIEYSALNKPTVFFTYDLDEYLANERGFYYDFKTTVPGDRKSVV